MKHVAFMKSLNTSMNLTPELLKAYKEYLAEFDPSPIGNGEDYLYPMDEDTFVEELLDHDPADSKTAFAERMNDFQFEVITPKEFN